MFKRIFIDNYRCFSNFEFLPGRVNLLLGDNGSGKSSLFDLLNAVVDLVVQGAEVAAVLPTTSLTRWDTREQQRIELELGNEGRTYKYVLIVTHDRDQGRASIESEKVTCDGRTLFAFDGGSVHLHRNDGREGASFPFRSNRSFLSQIEERPETTDLWWFLRFMSSVWMLRLDARGLRGISHAEEDTLDRDGANFASWYREFAQESPERLSSLWDIWKSAIPGLQSVKLVSSGGQGRVRDLLINMVTGGTSFTVELGELSDGQRALLVLYALLEAFDPTSGCLLLDEPEAHVGLPEVQPWLIALDRRVEDRGQVFVISHNPEVVDYLAASEPFLFERPGAGPCRARAAVFDRDCGLSASTQLARGLDNGE